jgi:hypothetical protein
LTISGNYNDTIPNYKGCDSIITIYLTINPSYNTSETKTVCIGSNYTFPDGITQTNITSSTTHTSKLQSVSSCDSIIVTKINITTIDTSVSVSNSVLTANVSGANYQWLNCNNNFSQINGETNQSFIPSANGNYALAVNTLNCNDTSSCYNINVNCFVQYKTSYDKINNDFVLTIDSTTSALSKNYYWDFGDGSNSTNTTPSHTYKIDSIYSVCLKITTANNDTCSYCHIIGKDYQGNIYKSSGFTINVVNPYSQSLGIKNNTSNENTYTLYPNPSTGELNILFNQQLNAGSIRIIGIMGQTILEKNNLTGREFSFSIENKASGVYFIEINDNHNFKRIKFIKQ